MREEKERTREEMRGGEESRGEDSRGEQRREESKRETPGETMRRKKTGRGERERR